MGFDLTLTALPMTSAFFKEYLLKLINFASLYEIFLHILNVDFTGKLRGL
jgi:hypothetical protein